MRKRTIIENYEASLGQAEHEARVLTQAVEDARDATDAANERAGVVVSKYLERKGRITELERKLSIETGFIERYSDMAEKAVAELEDAEAEATSWEETARTLAVTVAAAESDVESLEAQAEALEWTNRRANDQVNKGYATVAELEFTLGEVVADKEKLIEAISFISERRLRRAQTAEVELAAQRESTAEAVRDASFMMGKLNDLAERVARAEDLSAVDRISVKHWSDRALKAEAEVGDLRDSLRRKGQELVESIGAQRLLVTDLENTEDKVAWLANRLGILGWVVNDDAFVDADGVTFGQRIKSERNQTPAGSVADNLPCGDDADLSGDCS